MGIFWHVVASFFFALFICLALLVSTTFHDISPYASSPWARPVSRIAFVELFLKTSLPIFFHVFDYKYLWVLVLTVVVVNFAIFGAYLYFPPYYRFYYNMYACCLKAIQAWAAFCLLIALIEYDKYSPSASLLFYLAGPIVLLLAVFLMHMRYKDVLSGEPHSVYDVDFAIRTIMQPYIENINNVIRTQADHPLMTDDLNEHFSDAVQSCEDIFEEAITIFPHNCTLFLLLCQFKLFVRRDKSAAKSALHKCAVREPLADEMFLMFRLKRILDDTGGQDTVGDGMILSLCYINCSY